jgi:hypothetical protein
MSRYDLTDLEWHVIKSLLPDKPRGVLRSMTGACSVFQPKRPQKIADSAELIRACRAAVASPMPELGRYATVTIGAVSHFWCADCFRRGHIPSIYRIT